MATPPDDTANNGIKAMLLSPYTWVDCVERIDDQVVVEDSMAPLANLYFDLILLSQSLSENIMSDYIAFAT